MSDLHCRLKGIAERKSEQVTLELQKILPSNIATEVVKKPRESASTKHRRF